MKKIILSIVMLGVSFVLKAQDETVQGNLRVNGVFNLTSNNDAIMTFNNTDDSWQYIQFKSNGIRKTWLGLDPSNNFRITKENGGHILFKGANVGIGTDVPTAKLEVQNSDTGAGESYIRIKKSIDGSSVNREAGIILGTNASDLGNSFKIKTHSANPYFTAPKLDFEFIKPSGTGITSLLSINSIGNVGVGTTKPFAKLQVSGESTDRILISNSTVNYNLNSPKISLFGYTHGPQITGPSLQKISAGGGYGQGRLAILQHGKADYTSEEEVMSILPNGNVGIGEINPKGALQITKPNTISRTSVKDLLYLTTNHSNIGYDGFGTGIVDYRRTYKNSSPHVINRISFIERGNSVLDRGGAITFSTKELSSGSVSPIERLRIDYNGNVGIGTSTPDSRLSVNGKIHTKEVKVDLVGWPDFVFEKKYKLATLEEVERHIKEKGHLQDIPSAKEVKKNGIYLGEMNAKLLQKIEELTLYTIAQEKKIETQENNLNKLLKRIEKLEKK